MLTSSCAEKSSPLLMKESKVGSFKRRLHARRAVWALGATDPATAPCNDMVVTDSSWQWWRCEQCSGAALGLRLRCITIGLTWESYSTISHPCTHYTWLFNSPTRHTAPHLSQVTWPNLKTSSIVKVWNILIPLHHLTLRESLCFKNKTNKVVIYKHLLQAKMAPVCFVKIVLNWETIWPFDPGLTIRASDKAND